MKRLAYGPGLGLGKEIIGIVGKLHENPEIYVNTETQGNQEMIEEAVVTTERNPLGERRVIGGPEVGIIKNEARKEIDTMKIGIEIKAIGTRGLNLTPRFVRKIVTNGHKFIQIHVELVYLKFKIGYDNLSIQQD